MCCFSDVLISLPPFHWELGGCGLNFQSWNYNVCAVFLLDATFITDPAKFMSGALLSLSAMVQLELPHLNVLTKCDLADRSEVRRTSRGEVALHQELHGFSRGIENLFCRIGAASWSYRDYSDLSRTVKRLFEGSLENPGILHVVADCSRCPPLHTRHFVHLALEDALSAS